MYASESRVQTKVCRFAAQTKAAPLRRLAPARHGRPSRARCPRYAAHRKASRSMPSALADRGKAPYAGLPPAGRAYVPPPASGQPRSVRPSRCHLPSVPLQTGPQHCAPFTPTLPRTSTAARRSSSQKCLRSSCVRSHGSASPLRRGAAARQFPPSLCRCAGHPLRGPSTLDEPVCLGLCPSPRALGPGGGQGWCSKALSYPALWRRVQSVSVPGGELQGIPGSRPTPTPRRARVLRSIHSAHALSPLKH